MGAAALSAPHWALDEKEARQLAEAVEAVSEHYDFDVAPKAAAWAALGFAAVTIYGPRIYASASMGGKGGAKGREGATSSAPPRGEGEGTTNDLPSIFGTFGPPGAVLQ